MDDTPLIETMEPSTLSLPPPLHDTKIGITIVTETLLIDFTVKQIMILPSTSATITIYINTDKGQIERVMFMGSIDYLQWVDDSFLYGWILKNIKNVY